MSKFAILERILAAILSGVGLGLALFAFIGWLFGVKADVLWPVLAVSGLSTLLGIAFTLESVWSLLAQEFTGKENGASRRETRREG